MASKLQVILEAKGRDAGSRRLLRDLTKQSDELTASLQRATAAGKGLASMGGAPMIADGGGRRSTGSTKPRARSGGALDGIDRAQRDAARAAQAQSRAMVRQSRAADRAAKNIENLSDAQLVEIATQKEINSRRQRAAREAAKDLDLGGVAQRGQSGAAASGGRKAASGKVRGRGNIEVAENLAVVSGEFDHLADKTEAGVRSSWEAFRDYEKGIAEITTVTKDIPVDQIEKILADAVDEFGGLPTGQVAAFYEVVSAGATDAADATQQLEYANKLAIGGQSDTAAAIDIISKSVENFRSQGATAADAADSIFVAVQKGKVTVDQMGRALPAVAAASSAVGLTLDETNAALAVLSLRMPSAAEGAAGLKAAFSNLQAPSKKARKEAEALGIDFSVAGLKAAGSLEAFLLKLRAAKNFDDETIAKLFDSSEARLSIQNLIDGMDKFQETNEAMKSKAGKTNEAYNTMSKTAAQRAAKLQGQWEMLKITAGESLIPALEGIGKKIGPIIKDSTAWIKENGPLAATIGKVAIGVVVASRGLSALTSAMSMVKAVTGLAQSGLDSFAGSAGKASKASKGAAASVSSIEPGMSKLNVVLLGAAAAIAAFEFVLQSAQKPLNEYEDHADKWLEKQDEIKFQNADGTERSDEEILMERRNRLIADVNASRKLEVDAGGGSAWDQTMGGDVLGGMGAAYGGLLNRATGVQDEFTNQRARAESTLEQFDKEYGSKLGLGDQAFSSTKGFDAMGGGGGMGFEALAELMQRQVDASEKIASNTGQQQWWQGPSMEAGV
jgi:TP901 family phage tail tape measure protein